MNNTFVTMSAIRNTGLYDPPSLARISRGLKYSDGCCDTDWGCTWKYSHVVLGLPAIPLLSLARLYVTIRLFHFFLSFSLDSWIPWSWSSLLTVWNSWLRLLALYRSQCRDTHCMSRRVVCVLNSAAAAGGRGTGMAAHVGALGNMSITHYSS